MIQTFRVVLGLTLVQPHLAFQVNENIREQLADQEQDQSGVQKENARLFPAWFKPGNMRRDQVGQEKSPDDVPSRKPGNSELRARQGEEKKETFEIPVFRLVDADVHLIQRANEDKDHRARQTADSQFE